MIGFLRWFVSSWSSGNGVGCKGPLDIFVNGLFLCVSLPAIGRTLIPRYFSTVFEGGVTDLYYILKHSKESYHNSSITVDCDQCAMVTQHGKPMFTKVQNILSNTACSSVGVLKDNNYAFLPELWADFSHLRHSQLYDIISFVCDVARLLVNTVLRCVHVIQSEYERASKLRETGFWLPVKLRFLN